MRRVGIATAAAALAFAAPALAASAPTVTTGRATGVTPTTATLHGTVNPNGSRTTVFFQYGTSTSYRQGTQPASAGSGTRTVNVAASLKGLTPNTTYHYRIVAFNSAGISRGKDRTFKTPQVPTVAQIALGPNPALFGFPFVVAGRLTGPSNVGGKPVALQANPFPYTGGFHQVGNTELTTSNGGYTFTVAAASVNEQLRVVEQTAPNATSPAVTEFVFLDIHSIRVRHLRGHRVRLRGTILPGIAGARVLIQRELRHGRTRTVATARTVAVSPGKAVFVSRKFVLHRSGVYRVVVIPNTGAWVTSMTGPFILRR